MSDLSREAGSAGGALQFDDRSAGDDVRTAADRDTEPAAFRQRRFVPPPGAADLLLVRHGESAPAVLGQPFPLVDGHGDPALDPEGANQARQVAARLAGEQLAALYVTTLRRTMETAAPLAARLGLTPIVEADLREVFLGEWEGGALRQHIAEGHPIAQRIRAEQRWDVIPGAESSEAFAGRVRVGLTRIAARHSDQRVAVFTHGGVIGQALALAAGSRPFAFAGADNGSISRLVILSDEWIIRGYNDVSHLS